MLNVNASHSIPQHSTLDALKEVVVKEQQDLQNDLAADQQIAVIKELNALEKLKDFDYNKETVAIDRLNTSFKEFQIRKNILDDYLEGKSNLIYQQAYELQQKEARILDEVV